MWTVCEPGVHGWGLQGSIGYDVSYEKREGSQSAGPLAESQGQVLLAFQTLSYIKRWGAGEAGLWSAHALRSTAFQPVTNHLYVL